MAESAFSPLEHWRRNTHLLRAGLLQRVDELAVSDYPTVTPNQIIRFLQDFLAHLTDVIDKVGSEDQLKMLSSMIQQLGIFLEWLDNAHTEQTPRGLVQLLKDLIDRMDPESRVIARPQARYNYSIFDLGQLLKWLVDNYIPHSKQAGFQEYLDYPTKLISFPRIQRDNMPAHAIFGHELGHPISADYLDQESKKDAHKAAHAKIQQQVINVVQQKLAGSQVDDVQKLEVTTRIFDTVLQVRKRALEELISDAVGILIFGPSAFFACYELFWTSNWDARPAREEWYPPSRMRIRLMLDLMDELGYLDKFSHIDSDQNNTAPYVAAVQEFIREAKQLAAVSDDQSAIDAEPQLKIAYDWMKSSLPDAITFAKRATSAVVFQSDTVFQQLPDLIRRLELGVPPNEVGDPERPETVDYRASLLVAWMFKLRGINPDTGKALSSKEIDRLYEKTLSAIEYVILQNKYVQHLTATKSTNGDSI